MIIFILFLLAHSFGKRKPTDAMWVLAFFVGMAEFITLDVHLIGLA